MKKQQRRDFSTPGTSTKLVRQASCSGPTLRPRPSCSKAATTCGRYSTCALLQAPPLHLQINTVCCLVVNVMTMMSHHMCWQPDSSAMGSSVMSAPSCMHVHAVQRTQIGCCPAPFHSLRFHPAVASACLQRNLAHDLGFDYLSEIEVTNCLIPVVFVVAAESVSTATNGDPG